MLTVPNLRLCCHGFSFSSPDDLKTVVFWAVTPYNLVGGCRRFGAILCLHFNPGDGNSTILQNVGICIKDNAEDHNANTMKVEAARSSKTSESADKTRQCHNPEYHNPNTMKAEGSRSFETSESADKNRWRHNPKNNRNTLNMEAVCSS
jgi:hypothetical protein